MANIVKQEIIDVSDEEEEDLSKASTQLTLQNPTIINCPPNPMNLAELQVQYNGVLDENDALQDQIQGLYFQINQFRDEKEAWLAEKASLLNEKSFWLNEKLALQMNIQELTNQNSVLTGKLQRSTPKAGFNPQSFPLKLKSPKGSVERTPIKTDNLGESSTLKRETETACKTVKRQITDLKSDLSSASTSAASAGISGSFPGKLKKSKYSPQQPNLTPTNVPPPNIPVPVSIAQLRASATSSSSSSESASISREATSASASDEAPPLTIDESNLELDDDGTPLLPCDICFRHSSPTDEESPKWISCDQCQGWFHFVCVDLNEENAPGEKEPYFCKDCLDGAWPPPKKTARGRPRGRGRGRGGGGTFRRSRGRGSVSASSR